MKPQAVSLPSETASFLKRFHFRALSYKKNVTHKSDNNIDIICNHIGNAYVVSDANITWYMDWVSRNNIHVLILVDAASRAILAAPCYKKDPSALNVIEILTTLFEQYKCPKIIHTDQGGAFTAKILKDFLIEKGVKLSYGFKNERSFNNQAMESINAAITHYLDIHKTDKPFQKACGFTRK